MRLASLARKIKMKPTALISFLVDLGIKLKGGSNTKLDKKTVDMVLNTYAPELLERETEIEENIESEEPQVNDLPEANTTVEQEIKGVEKEWSDELELIVDQPPIEEEEKNSPEPKEVDPKDEIELIKVPKIILPGLRIRGKIELPEPEKKTQTEKGKKVESKSEKAAPIIPRRHSGKKDHKISEDHNPLEEARKRAAREEERKRIRQAKQKKESRRNRYEREIQSKIKPMKLSRPIKDQGEDSTIEETELKHQGNVFSRFWHWFNT